MEDNERFSSASKNRYAEWLTAWKPWTEPKPKLAQRFTCPAISGECKCYKPLGHTGPHGIDIGNGITVAMFSL